MPAGQRKLVSVTTGAVCALALILLVAFREQVVRGTWRIVAQTPITADQQHAVATCGDLGWRGVVKVIERDLPDRCDGLWLARHAADGAGPRRVEWLAEIAEDPSRRPRQRLRAGLAVWIATGDTPRGMALLLADPAIAHDARAAVVAELAARGETPAWADPSLASEIAVARLRSGDWDVAPDIAATLRLHANGMVLGDPTAAVDAALDAIGLGAGRLPEWIERRRHGLPLHDVPRPWLRTLANQGADCADVEARACLARIATWLEDGPIEVEDDELRATTPDAPATLASPLWDAAFAGDVRTVDAAEHRFARAADWIAAGRPGERRGRLLGLVAHRRHRYGLWVERHGGGNDPLLVLERRRGAPWSTALAAVVLGEAAGLGVSVSAAGEGVSIEVGGRRVGVGPCGTTLSLPAVAGAPWPRRAVLAQAAIEAAGGALRRGDVNTALRLAVLAERTDATGAAGSVDAVLARFRSVATPDVGASAGAMVRETDVPPPVGADDERRFRAATLPVAAAEWNARADREARCPAPLGP